RGAVGADPMAGDGAGILIQLPDAFLREVFAEQKVTLPAPGDYGIGMVFLPKAPLAARDAMALIERVVREEGQSVLGWRDVNVDSACLGETVRNCEPWIRQIAIARGPNTPSEAFERKLFVIRKFVQNYVRTHGGDPRQEFYIPSMSSRTLVY